MAFWKWKSFALGIYFRSRCIKCLPVRWLDPSILSFFTRFSQLLTWKSISWMERRVSRNNERERHVVHSIHWYNRRWSSKKTIETKFYRWEIKSNGPWWSSSFLSTRSVCGVITGNSIEKCSWVCVKSTWKISGWVLQPKCSIGINYSPLTHWWITIRLFNNHQNERYRSLWMIHLVHLKTIHGRSRTTSIHSDAICPI